MCNYQIDTFAVSKDEWNTKEDIVKSAFNCCGMPKGTSQAEVMQNTEKIKSIPSAIQC